MLRKFASVVTAAVIAGAGLSAPAQASPAPAPASQGSALATCGFHEAGAYAFYNHCGTGAILIRVDIAGGGSGNDRCIPVGAGETLLGSAKSVLNAYYLSSGVCNI